MIYKIRNKDDERNVFIRLTDAGSALKEKAAEIPGKLVCGINLSPQKAIELREELKQLLASLADS